MKLYYSPASCALSVHIALEEAGAEYEAIRVNFDKQEQRSPEYLKINPLGRVPVLQTEEGTLTEAPAILGFVAAKYPSARLAPTDPFKLAQMNSFTAFLSSSIHTSYAHRSRPYRYTDDEAAKPGLVEKGIKTFLEQMAMVESGKLAGPWVMGDQFTVADGYLFVMTRWMTKMELDTSPFPRIMDHFERVGQRAGVQRALAAQGLI
jgi:glutathione S-transferase